jgi:hypothetical protein
MIDSVSGYLVVSRRFFEYIIVEIIVDSYGWHACRSDYVATAKVSASRMKCIVEDKDSFLFWISTIIIMQMSMIEIRISFEMERIEEIIH